LYGLWLGKKTIQDKDSCYLVEGYMDVIAMHQSGIENVVASSGTSLTIEQIKSIHRFTRNIVVLYDGDEAGQKASNRAIPLLLEEGMNVRLLQFPDNDDPDSYSRKVGVEAFQEYIQNNTTDFLYFKAKKLKADTQNDPIKRAGVIKDIVENIALIPDNIIRSIYIRECSGIMEIEESVLQVEVNKIRRKSGQKNVSDQKLPDAGEIVQEILAEQPPSGAEMFKADGEEKQLLRIMLRFGSAIISVEAEDENDEPHQFEITVAEYILFELWRDNITFENPIHQTVLDEFIFEISNQKIPKEDDFIRSSNPLISGFTIDHVVEKHVLSQGWSHYGVSVPSELGNVKRDTVHQLFSLKEKKLNQFILEKQELLKAASAEETTEILKEILHLTFLKSRVNKLLGRIVIK
jgi:DNA primase